MNPTRIFRNIALGILAVATLPAIAWAANFVTIHASGAITSGSTVTATGFTAASGSANTDLSASSGTFKTTTGAVTVGPGAVGLSGATTVSSSLAGSGTATFDLSGASGIFKTSTGAVTVGPGAVTISGALSASNVVNRGTCTLGTNCAAITVASGAVCVCADTSSAAACKAVVSGTSLAVTGTGTDGIAWICL